MGTARDLQILHVCVPVPRVQGLVEVEAIAVPFVDCRGASFGAVCNDKEGLAILLKCLHIVGLPYPEDVNILDLDELVSGDIPFVDMGAPEQLGYNDEQLAVNHQWFANHSGGT